MSLTDILNAITIVNDCSSYWVNVVVAAVAIGLISILGVVALILKTVRASFTYEISKSIILMVGTIISAGVSVTLIWYSITSPYIKMYIAANDVPVTELSTYFELDNISSADENTFLYISPKPEYYGETLEWYRQNNEQAASS